MGALKINFKRKTQVKTFQLLNFMFSSFVNSVTVFYHHNEHITKAKAKYLKKE